MSVSAPGSLARVITHPNQWPPAGVDGCYVVGSGSDRRFMQVRSTLVRGGIAALAAAAAVMIGSPAALAADGAARGRVVADDHGNAKATVGYRHNRGKGGGDNAGRVG